MKRNIIFFLLLTLTACQMKPTKVTQTATYDSQFLLKQLAGPIKLDEKTIVIDTRPTFEYSLAHIPGAINLSWEDFAQPRAAVRGKVTADLPALTKRLAILGLSPAMPVVVVGSGKAGAGEDGRVAWSLTHLGFYDVQLVSNDYFKSGMNNAEPPARPNAPEWTAKPRAELEAQKSEVQAVATAVMKEGERKTSYLLDVRTRKEYFMKRGLGEGYVTPDLGALHIPWTEFYTQDGRPNAEIRNQILALGWQPSDRIVVISDHGVRSGAVAFILSRIGFTNVANYTGGYSELTLKGKGPKLRPVGK
ncbi:MAG: sulfurtransferase [Bdellovibrionales bacterium]